MAVRIGPITDEHRAAWRRQVEERVRNLTPEEREQFLQRQERARLARVALQAVREVVRERREG